MGSVNELILGRYNYDDVHDFECTIQNAVTLLLNAGYVMTVKYDDKENGIIVIEYEYDDDGQGREFGCKYPYWLSPEELNILIQRKYPTIRGC